MNPYPILMSSTEPGPEGVRKPLEEISKRSLVKARREGAGGSILLILSIIPYIGAIFGTVGFVLILMAGKRISQNLGNRLIFKHLLVAAILGILGVVIEAVWLHPSLTFYTLTFTNPARYIPLNIILAFIIIWILTLISAAFLRKSLRAIASGLGVRRFGTAALLYLIGAVLILFTILGFLIIFIAEIALAIAFLSVPLKKGVPG